MEKEEFQNKLILDIDKLIIRNYIRLVFPNYDNEQTYVVYDGGKEIEIYRKEMLGLRKALNQVRGYTISYPIRII